LFALPINVFGATEIKWWNISSRKELSERLVKDFNAANPDIKIVPTLNAVSDHRQKLMIAASSDSLPDIWFNWGGTLGSFFPENGLTYDLTDYAKANDWDGKFSKTALTLSTLAGQLAGYPTSMAMIGIYYKKDVFDKYGLSEPKTFAEFEEIMATLKSKGHTPMIVAGKPGWHVMRYIEALIEMYAGSKGHDDLKAFKTSWDSEPVIKAFAKFKEHMDKGYFPKGFITLGGSDAKSLLYSGDGVMDIEGPWAESNLFNDKQDPSKYGYFKLPLSSKGNRMSGFVEMIQFKSGLSNKKLEAAMEFVDYIYSPESIEKYGKLIKQPVPRTDNKLPSNLIFTPMMIRDLNKYGSYTISDQGLPQEVVQVLFQVQGYIASGKMSPKQAAEFMQEGIEKHKASQ
jgi:raffinose/stachyose/melibiose transport system substrate-binding protein